MEIPSPETPTAPEPDEYLLTAAVAAKRMSLGKSTFWREVKNGNIPPPIKIGSATRWRVADITQFIAQQSTC